MPIWACQRGCAASDALVCLAVWEAVTPVLELPPGWFTGACGTTGMAA